MEAVSLMVVKLLVVCLCVSVALLVFSEAVILINGIR